MEYSTLSAFQPHEGGGGPAASYTQAEATKHAKAKIGDHGSTHMVAPTGGGSCDGRTVVDWMSATVEHVTPSHLLLALGYDLNGFVDDKPTHEERGRTSNRYGHKLSNQGITILHKGTDGAPGCRLDMTGEGCRQWERDHPGLSFLDLLVTIQRLEPKMHRMDVATDDFASVLDMGTLEAYREEHFFVYKGQWNAYSAKGTGDNAVETIWFGSPKSDFRMKFYNRGHLLEELGMPPDSEAPVSEDGWVRAEVQVRNEQARAMLDRIVALGSVSRANAEALARVSFKEPNPDDSNLSRWNTASFWRRFLGNAQSARLASPQSMSTLQSKMAWLYRQVAPAIALLWIQDGEAGLIALARHGLRALKPHHLALLTPEKRKQAELALAGVSPETEEREDGDLSEDEMQTILADIAEEDARRAWVEEMLTQEAGDEHEPDHCGWNACVPAPEGLSGYQGPFNLGGAA